MLCIITLHNVLYMYIITAIIAVMKNEQKQIVTVETIMVTLCMQSHNPWHVA